MEVLSIYNQLDDNHIPCVDFVWNEHFKENSGEHISWFME